MLDEDGSWIETGEDEAWLPIAGFSNYLISNLGQIKHVDRHEPRKFSINHQGFPVVVLWMENSSTRYPRQVSKLVAETFLAAPDPEIRSPTVWHIDGNFENCRADNLKWDRRDRVLEWNDMQRTGQPKYRTRQVMYNRTGDIFADAYEAGMATGEIESAVIGNIEKYPEQYADRARYRYL
jgi:hypothetical protein